MKKDRVPGAILMQDFRSVMEKMFFFLIYCNLDQWFSWKWRAPQRL